QRRPAWKPWKPRSRPWRRWRNWSPARRWWRPATGSTSGGSGGKDVSDANLATSTEALREVVLREARGEPWTLPEVRKVLQDPKLVNIFGDLAAQVEQSLIRAAVGDSELRRGALERKLEEMRAELGGPDPTPLERLVVDRVVVCWLHLHYLE